MFLRTLNLKASLHFTKRYNFSDFTYKDLVAGIKDKKFNKIVVMTGAGISVSSGIPSFRGAKGFYKTADANEYNVPYLEAIFDFKYFISDPFPFYKFTNKYFNTKYLPAPTHKFIKLL